MIKYPWKAIYSDGGCIEQYVNGQEVSYRVVEEAQEMPSEFIIGNMYSVNLKTGIFYVAGYPRAISYMVGREPYNTDPTKLIYFRRVLNVIDLSTGKSHLKIDHFFGYKYRASLEGRPEEITGEILMCVTEQGESTLCVGIDP